MKILLSILIAGFLLSPIIPQKSFSQDTKIKTKLKQKTSTVKKLSSEEITKIISKNTKSFKKNLNGTWLLQEDFESGIFPPAGWVVNSGSTMWEQYSNISGYGIGNYCMFYSNWNCNYSNNIIYTSSFNSLTQTGDKLIFDYAYAPYDDGISYYDDLEIYYYDDNEQSWYSLIYYNGEDLQTAPGTNNYFIPQSNEWGTKTIDIPENASALYFQSWEDCDNNFFIDNIRVGTLPPNGNEASVEKVWAKGKLPLVYGVPDKISALIKNNSALPMNNLKVYLNISGVSNLSDSLEILSIGPGDTMQVDFMGFTPILNGFSTVTISLPDDDNNGNNSLDFLSESNLNSIRYVDSNCCNGAVGWVGEYSFISKYKMSGTGQIRNVKIKISDGGNVGQIVYATVLDNNGTIVGKSPHYKIQATDEGKYKTFNITDPKPIVINNNYYYVGISQTQYAGDGFAFTPQQFLYDVPSRPDANYFAGLAPIGTFVGAYEFPREYGQNYAIEAVIGNQVTIDAGVSDLGLTYDQYFSATSFSPVGRVFNAGTGSATFTVNRKITPGSYTSTKTVTALTAGGNANVTFDPWTFTSGTTYTIRDSVILSGDGNTANNVMSNIIVPRIAKQMCVLWQQQEDRDSLVRAINSDGRYVNNFDTVRMNYTGSYLPWKIMFVNLKSESNYAAWTRDSLKSYLDKSTAGNKKTMIVFSNSIALSDEPDIGFPNPADTVFYRQYLKSRTISDNWPGSIPNSQNKFRGIGFFDGITQDSIADPFTPELIKPVNGSISAFKPKSVTGNGSDSCNAVCYAGANYNTFFITNKFSSLRSTNASPILDGPVLVYTKIMDWIQSVNTGVKILDLTVLLEGFYDPNINSMIRDTVRVYLRNATNPFAIVDSSKDLLSPAGLASFIFNNAANGVNYYLQIKHRNALETWSKTTVSFTSNHLNYNFTTNANKAFGDNMVLSGSKYVIYEGDVNHDGSVDLNDNAIIENDAFNFESGYIVTDVNGDGIADLNDQAIADNNAYNFVVKLTPLSSPQILAKKGIVLEKYDQNSEIISQKMQNSEIEIDNEIYEKHKNDVLNNFKIPKFEITDNGKNQRIIKLK